MKDFNDILILEKTKHKSSVFFYVIILLFLLLPLKSFAQSDQFGIFSTDPGVINTHSIAGAGAFNDRIEQSISSSTVSAYFDSNGNFLIDSITFYVKNTSSSAQVWGLGSIHEYGLGGSGSTGSFCSTKTIPGNFEGFFTWDDCIGYTGRSPFEGLKFSIYINKSTTPRNLEVYGFSSNHWSGGDCVNSAGANCTDADPDLVDYYFNIDISSFGGWVGFDPNDITPPSFDPLFDTSSYIKWVDPVNNEVVSTSSFPIEVEVYIDDKEEDLFPNNFLNYSLVAEFQSYAEAPEIENVYSIVIDDEIKISDILGSVETYYATSSILSTEGFYLSVVKLVPNPYTVLTGTYLLSDTIGINVGTTTTDFYEVVSANSLCSDYSFPVDGICRVFVRLFVPQIPFSTYLKQLSETMRSKIPFAYFYRVNDILSDVSGVEKSLSSTDITIVNPLFGSVTFFDWSVLATQFDNWFSGVWVYFEYLVWASFVSYLVFRFMHINL